MLHTPNSDLGRRKREFRLNNSLHSSIHQRRLASLKVWQGIATIEYLFASE